MKLEKEITVQINSNYNTLHQDLISKNFKIVDQFQMNDIYMVPNHIDIQKGNVLDILKSCILIREIEGISKSLVYKYKKYNDKNEILEQGKTKCTIDDIDDALNFLKAIGYKELISIQDKCITYTNNDIEFYVQLVNDKYVFIEMEDEANFIDKKFNTINEMITSFEAYNLDYDKNNYYVKKAEIIFNEMYR